MQLASAKLSLLITALFFSSMAVTAPTLPASTADNATSFVFTSRQISNVLDSTSYSGIATWYSPKKSGGIKAACGGKIINDESEIVALNAHQYGDMSKDSDWCGLEIEIAGPKGTAKAIILDACPKCKSGGLDLTPILFERVCGSKRIGAVGITWKVI